MFCLFTLCNLNVNTCVDSSCQDGSLDGAYESSYGTYVYLQVLLYFLVSPLSREYTPTVRNFIRGSVRAILVTCMQHTDTDVMAESPTPPYSLIHDIISCV